VKQSAELEQAVQCATQTHCAVHAQSTPTPTPRSCLLRPPPPPHTHDPSLCPRLNPSFAGAGPSEAGACQGLDRFWHVGAAKPLKIQNEDKENISKPPYSWLHPWLQQQALFPQPSCFSWPSCRSSPRSEPCRTILGWRGDPTPPSSLRPGTQGFTCSTLQCPNPCPRQPPATAVGSWRERGRWL
jgi:hypothetical protein